MVPDRERAAQLAVLVADGVEAVRAGRDDRPLPHPVAVERLDVLAGQDLEHVLVAHATGRVAGAALLLAEDGERDAGGVQAGGDGPGDSPVAVVEGGRAADPVEDLEVVERPARLDLGDGPDRERQPLRPVQAGGRRLAPRVAHALHAPEGGRELLREAAVLQDQVPAQADDLVHVLDGDRAGLHAGAAGQAVPDRVVRDGGVHERAGDGLGPEACRRGRRWPARTASWGSAAARPRPPRPRGGCP